MRGRASGLVAGLIVACILSVVSVLLLKPIRATATAKPAQRADTDGNEPNKNDQVSARAVSNVDGDWDLIWKDARGHMIRVSLTIEGEGHVLKVRARGGQGIRLEEHPYSAGEATENGLRFKLQPNESEPLMFSGAFVNGILVGSTNTAAQWMAMPSRN